MESILREVESALSSSTGCDDAALERVFRSGSYSSLGSGEQRALHAATLVACVASPTFLKRTTELVDRHGGWLEEVCLPHLPTAGCRDAADNVVRRALFRGLVAQGAYERAARLLSTVRMEDADADGTGASSSSSLSSSSPYHTTPAERCEVSVQIAECYLQAENYEAADAAVQAAGTVLSVLAEPLSESAKNATRTNANATSTAAGAEIPRSLVLRYKSTHARVLDHSRKYHLAAAQYWDLSQASDDDVDADELLFFLGRAVTCVVLAPLGPQRQSLLSQVAEDPRVVQTRQLDHSNLYSAVPPGAGGTTTTTPTAELVRRLCRNQIVPRSLWTHGVVLQPHQEAVGSDGRTVLHSRMMEHNLLAASKMYVNIRFAELAYRMDDRAGGGTDADVDMAMTMAAKMITNGTLRATMDEVDSVLTFTDEVSPLAKYDRAITDLCRQLNVVTDAIRAGGQ